MARWNRVCEGFVPFSVRPSSRFLSAPRPILSLVHFKGTHTHIDELEDFNYVDISRNNFHYTGSWYSFCLNKLHTCTDPLSVVTEIQTICWSQSVQPVDYRRDLLMYNPESVLCLSLFHVLSFCKRKSQYVFSSCNWSFEQFSIPLCCLGNKTSNWNSSLKHGFWILFSMYNIHVKVMQVKISVK